MALKRPERPEVMVLGVESLERCQKAARERLEGLLKVVDSDPLGAENGPHQYTYKPSLDPEQDTVVAPKTCNEPAGRVISSSPASVRQEPTEKGRVLKLHPDELVRLAPRLKPYLRRPSPTWSDLVDAADWLRHDLDVSKPLWGEACLAMGREQAAIALAVVSTKDPAHFRTTPGGYFHGMVAKAKAGELNLDRTLWAMRRAAEPKPRPKPALSS
jgi:replication initiation protein RepC